MKHEDWTQEDQHRRINVVARGISGLVVVSNCELHFFEQNHGLHVWYFNVGYVLLMGLHLNGWFHYYLEHSLLSLHDHLFISSQDSCRYGQYLLDLARRFLC
jgi:hypothetical protein